MQQGRTSRPPAASSAALYGLNSKWYVDAMFRWLRLTHMAASLTARCMVGPVSATTAACMKHKQMFWLIVLHRLHSFQRYHGCMGILRFDTVRMYIIPCTLHSPARPAHTLHYIKSHHMNSPPSRVQRSKHSLRVLTATGSPRQVPAKTVPCAPLSSTFIRTSFSSAVSPSCSVIQPTQHSIRLAHVQLAIEVECEGGSEGKQPGLQQIRLTLSGRCLPLSLMSCRTCFEASRMCTCARILPEARPACSCV